MLEVKLKRTIAIPARQMWTAFFFDDEFMSSLYEHLRIKVSDIAMASEGGWPALEITRSQYLEPDRAVPAILMKLVRGLTQIREVTRFSAPARTFVATLELPVIARRVDVEYVYSWTELADDRTQLWFHGRVHARLSILSRRAEAYLMSELTQGTLMVSEYIDRWFDIESEAPIVY